MIHLTLFRALGTAAVLLAVQTFAAEIHIDPAQTVHPISRYLTGACIEDVNHEIYGGIDSQMIFGESFGEPPPQRPFKGFQTFGNWTLADQEIHVVGGEGSKLVSGAPVFNEGEASVELKFNDGGSGNAGFIVKVSGAGKGHDEFNGYEVALEPSGNLLLGRHRQNWEFIRRVPCNVPIGSWVKLTVRMKTNSLSVMVNGKMVTSYEDTESPLQQGTVGLRTWQRDASFRNLTVITDGETNQLEFIPENQPGWDDGVSRMWRPMKKGTAAGKFTIVRENPFSGNQSQQLIFSSGKGELGIENQGLNRWGMNLVKGRKYEGYLHVRAETAGNIFVALESRDGEKVYAEKRLKVSGDKWQRLDFTLEPRESDPASRFTIKLKQPGSATVGYAFLQPGKWGRFKGLPVRKDVGEGLVNQGLTVLRYGGCMANAEGYRWKKMIGPRAQRPPYAGWWYPHSSNGWGIFDFLNFCEGAGFLAVPDVNANETAQDMADFIDYVNGPTDSEWGRKRAADGHPSPYRLKYLQIGNEEQVNETYWARFKPVAEAIWAKDPEIILVVGDFAYNHVIRDPFNFTGADGRITSLAAHQKILQLAKQHDREVWFDVHVWTDGPRPTSSLDGMFSYIDALGQIADGAKHKVVVFELNANNHSQRRALANALALNAIIRDGRLPIVASANGLQPDGQNDNGWDQGLLFLNPSKVWSQPPGYAMRMMSQNHQALLVLSEVRNGSPDLDVIATRSKDGKSLGMRVVNVSAAPITAGISVTGFSPIARTARVEELSASLNSGNTSAATERVAPYVFEWQHGIDNGKAVYQFPPHSFTLIQMK